MGVSFAVIWLCLVSQVFVLIPYTYAGFLRKSCTPGEPCRAKFEIRFSSGHPFVRNEGTPCSCGHAVTCPSDWSLTDQVVSKDLELPGFQAELKLMFCGDSEYDDLRTCEQDETAVVFKSTLQYPTDLKSYKCRCPDDKPLLQRKLEMKNYQYTSSYVCDDSMARCSEDDACLTTTSEETTYHCKCPGQKSCDVQHGYCY